MEQPFYVGQRVIALKDSVYGYFKKGTIYKVFGIEKACCVWAINIGKTVKSKIFACSMCDKTIARYGDKAVHNVINFAPIQETYSDATNEILEKFPITHETPDKVLTPEKIHS